MKTKVLSLFLIASCVFVMAAACEVTTANITDVRMCDNSQNLQCPADNPSFTTTTPEIFCTVVLNNAPEGTQITASWYYLEDEQTFIDSAMLLSEETASDLEFLLTKPTNDWPTGNYKVELQINNEEPLVKEFSVK